MTESQVEPPASPDVDEEETLQSPMTLVVWAFIVPMLLLAMCEIFDVPGMMAP